MKHFFSCILLFSMLLGCHKGYIALRQAGEVHPLRVYPYPVSSLPPADQAALKEGIPISNPEELAQRLEDFLS